MLATTGNSARSSPAWKATSADLKDSGVVASEVTRQGVVTLSRDAKVDELASVRARLGYTVLPNLLAYGTAGLGWGHTEVSITESAARGSVSLSSSANNFGWAAGAGLEYKLWGNFIARAEYLHYDLGKSTYNFLGTPFLPIDDDLVIIHRGPYGDKRISNIRRNDDGSVVWDVEDIEDDETSGAAPVAADPAASVSAARGDPAPRPPVDPLYATMGDPEFDFR